MRPFDYFAAHDVSEAVRLLPDVAATSGDPQAAGQAQYLAGGTTLLDLMKLESCGRVASWT
jgi:CO/xanthine dehydrogenase FAD-binding subunit